MWVLIGAVCKHGRTHPIVTSRECRTFPPSETREDWSTWQRGWLRNARSGPYHSRVLGPWGEGGEGGRRQVCPPLPWPPRLRMDWGSSWHMHTPVALPWHLAPPDVVLRDGLGLWNKCLPHLDDLRDRTRWVSTCFWGSHESCDYFPVYISWNNYTFYFPFLDLCSSSSLSAHIIPLQDECLSHTFPSESVMCLLISKIMYSPTLDTCSCVVSHGADHDIKVFTWFYMTIHG